MTEELMKALCNTGAFAAISFAAIGSGLGAGAGGSAAIGGWKKCYANNKPAPFQLIIFAGAPLSQTIYGMIMMFIIINSSNPAMWPVYLMMGVVGGIALGVSAWCQGKAAAGACDAFAAIEGQGFVNYLMVLGIIETVAIFVLAFGIVTISMIK
ncbi:MAG: hypothetical protein WC071_00230 [Victivallaceae bacterium]